MFCISAFLWCFISDFALSSVDVRLLHRNKPVSQSVMPCYQAAVLFCV